MTQDEKDLLLKDLCARLPYSVKLSVQSWDEREMEYIDRVDVLYSANGDEYIKTVSEDYDFSIEDIKPYLFPLSSMTEGQNKEYNSIIYFDVEPYNERYFEAIDVDSFEKLQDFYHKNHFDYRGLIEKGLAIDATNLNIY